MAATQKIALGIIVVLVLTSGSSAVQEKAATSAQPGTSTRSACYQRLADSMAEMHRAMAAVKPSSPSDADLDFVRLMLPHHQAALEMAKVELECGTDPQMRRLAQEIITDQQSEIQLMQLWLKRRGK